MITEDYCSFELAKLLKEKGFIEMCYMYYEPDKHGYALCGERFENHNYVKEEISCPTHQMAMKWLREVHKLFIVIEPEYFEAGRVIAYDFSVWCGDNYKHNFKDNPTYEEAVEAALKYVLENLI